MRYVALIAIYMLNGVSPVLFLSCPGIAVLGMQRKSRADPASRLLINGLFRRAPLLLAHVLPLQYTTY